MIYVIYSTPRYWGEIFCTIACRALALCCSMSRYSEAHRRSSKITKRYHIRSESFSMYLCWKTCCSRTICYCLRAFDHFRAITVFYWWMVEAAYGGKSWKRREGALSRYTELYDWSTFTWSICPRMKKTLFRDNALGGEPFINSTIPHSNDMGDGLDSLVWKSLHDMNHIALESTAKAHNDGGCPSMTITLDALDEYTLWYFLYTMMYACALSGVMIGINPFDQPGVEAYKGEMRKRHWK